MLLREVLGYSAAETAEMLGSSVASVNSALQCAQKAAREKLPAVLDPAVHRRFGLAEEVSLSGTWVRHSTSTT